ncbi:MAG: hypothetical protein GY756_02825 [bacterium]|nr:hypothetical protein [bacterium]
MHCNCTYRKHSFACHEDGSDKREVKIWHQDKLEDNPEQITIFDAKIDNCSDKIKERLLLLKMFN